MTNVVASTELSTSPQCTIDDIGLVEKNIVQYWAVDKDGEPVELLETFMEEASYDYYDCGSCGRKWHIDNRDHPLTSKQTAWQKAEAHIRDE